MSGGPGGEALARDGTDGGGGGMEALAEEEAWEAPSEIPTEGRVGGVPGRPAVGGLIVVFPGVPSGLTAAAPKGGVGPEV